MGKALYVRRKIDNEDGEGQFDRIMKMSMDLEGQGHYDVHKAYTGEMICSCPARQTECRHVRMIPMFDLAEAGMDPEYKRVQDENPDNEIWLFSDGKKIAWMPGPIKQAIQDEIDHQVDFQYHRIGRD